MDTESPDTPTNPEISGGINGLTSSASDKLAQTFGSSSGGKVGSRSRDLLDPGDESESGLTTPKHSATLVLTSSGPPSPTLEGHEREASRTPTTGPVALPT